jgi:hypothetical protein
LRDIVALVRLKNVHTAINPVGIANSKLYLVDGDYDYYHYLQDQIDDNVCTAVACLAARICACN